MTELHSEYLPFADTDEEEAIKWIQETVERQLLSAYDNQVISEITYRRMVAEVADIDGNEYDHFIRLMLEFIDFLEIDEQDRIAIGEDFISKLPPDDEKMERAILRLERLRENFANHRKWRDEFERHFEYDQADREEIGERKESA